MLTGAKKKKLIIRELHRLSSDSSTEMLQARREWQDIFKVLKGKNWSAHCGSVVMNPTSIHEDVASIPGLIQWVNPALL